MITLEINNLIDRTSRPLVNLISVTPSDYDYANKYAGSHVYNKSPVVTSDCMEKLDNDIQ